MNWIYEPWPWYVSGPIIALIMYLLIMLGKNFGMSANLRTICTIYGAGNKADFFKFDWKSQKWNLVVVIGFIVLSYGFFNNVVFVTPYLIITSTEEISLIENVASEKVISVLGISLIIGGSIILAGLFHLFKSFKMIKILKD